MTRPRRNRTTPRKNTTLALVKRVPVCPPIPAVCHENAPDTFAPAHDFCDWIRNTFIRDTGTLFNRDHAHLMAAHIGVLWTNVRNVSRHRIILGTAEIPNANTGGWRRGRFEHQLREWFGDIPDFVLTFSAPDCARLADRVLCALVEHELYHCAQAVDQFGAPKFNQQTGRPLFTLRAHDVEEFTGVVARYGIVNDAIRQLVDAASTSPRVSDDTIALGCGTCRRVA